MLPPHRNLRIEFAAAMVAGLLAAAPGRAAPVDFDRDVRPILSDRCYPCHGPDAEARQADLRLDQQTSALEDRDGRPAFRAGDVGQSEALRRIFSEDPDERMPPPDSKLELSTAEQQILRRWVDEGAPWTEHWAFAPPVKPELPTGQDAAWPRGALDYFVLARLERAGQKPSPPAPPEKLLRRVTLDLTGLPPTLAELDEFLADPSDAAYLRAVDRLLNSHRYGERMAWQWLDAARYADTDGFQGDPARTMWPWRDWLIRSLNDNLPFDQFTVQMLAGDLLPEASDEQILATGFNRNHMHNGEQVLAKNVKRAAQPDQEQPQLRLAPGENRLLLKIVNTGGIGGFYFRSLRESLHGFPAEIETIVLASPAVRTSEQRRSSDRRCASFTASAILQLGKRSSSS